MFSQFCLMRLAILTKRELKKISGTASINTSDNKSGIDQQTMRGKQLDHWNSGYNNVHGPSQQSQNCLEF